MNDELFEAACAYYGTCIGSKYCMEMTVEFLMSEHGLSKTEAVEVATAAFKEWVEAYE